MSGYFVVAVGTVCPASHFVAVGGTLQGGPVSFHVLAAWGLFILSLLPPPPLLERVSLSQTCDCPAVLSLHQASSQEPVSDWVKFKAYLLLFR